MSSKIEIQRICQHCSNEFTAKTTVTKYCSDVCAKRAYKVRKRKEKIEASNSESLQIKTHSFEQLKTKDFLTISEACELLSISRWTIWRAIKRNELNAGKIGRRTLIRRSDLELLFEQPQPIEPIPSKPANINHKIEDCYKLAEIREKYGISDSTLHNLIKRNNIPKIKQGWYTYVPKNLIENLLS